MADRKKLVALTGAGISAESGIPTFAGRYSGQYNVKEVTSVDGWNRNPEMVLRFYNERREQLAHVEPNAAHRILAELENEFDVTVITQNVDNLHERAGSTKVIHLHGELTKVRSSRHPEMIFDIGYRPIQWGEQAPDRSQLRPHIVWFGEPVSMIEAAQATVAAADIFVIVGSGLEIFPAAELVKYARTNASIFLINPNEVKNQGRYMTVIRENATVGMEKLKKILAETPNESPKDGKMGLYNVIILDQSGSMESIKREAIEGYNETIQTIKAAQRQYADLQNHFVTLVVFNGSAHDTVYDCVACTAATELTEKTYKPDSNTPLYDAMGDTLSRFRHRLAAENNYSVLVTIITDGQENASREYTGKQIHQMVNELKTLGWVFTYIGADHDVEEAARSIGVNNVLCFDKSSIGAKTMFDKEQMCRLHYYSVVAENKQFTDGKYFDDKEESSDIF